VRGGRLSIQNSADRRVIAAEEDSEKMCSRDGRVSLEAGLQFGASEKTHHALAKYASRASTVDCDIVEWNALPGIEGGTDRSKFP